MLSIHFALGFCFAIWSITCYKYGKYKAYKEKEKNEI